MFNKVHKRKYFTYLCHPFKMPTLEQLNIIFESQLEFFGGAGLPKENFDGNADGNGLTQEKINDTPLNSYKNEKVSDGFEIAKISFNKTTKKLTFNSNI
jgi:hypothetical protein